MAESAKLTLNDIGALYSAADPIVAITAYDAAIGRLADEAGAHIILVGDSLGMTALGYGSTIFLDLEQSLHHTAAVVRGVNRALVIGDMPFLTFQVSPEEALRNAGRYLTALPITAETNNRLTSAGLGQTMDHHRKSP